MDKSLCVELNQIVMILNQKTLAIQVEAHGAIWQTDPVFEPTLETSNGTERLMDAHEITHIIWQTGVGKGLRSSFVWHGQDGVAVTRCFETIIWIESASGDIHFEWVPGLDTDLRYVNWPGPLAFGTLARDWYTVVNFLQGVLIPNGWPTATGKLNFDGQLCSTAAYMPWWGQVRPGSGYIAICQTPWDAAYSVIHPAGGDCQVNIRWLSSLGRMSYRRQIRYTFFGSCDYNDLCKAYRSYAVETGLLTTLREKAVRNPLVEQLVGAAFVHTGIKKHIVPQSAYYDPDHPERNDALTPFSTRQDQMIKLQEHGVDRAYLHLDGWGEPGYDNQHPDYLPPCEAAGGWAGMQALADTLQQLGYLFGIHDQYRDYYCDAATFDPDFAARQADGSIVDFSRWAGGRQTYLCASQAPLYVKRNFEELLRHGVHLDGAYLDVFTCNEPDECTHPWHVMSRKECLDWRSACFDYLTSRGILPSSEEVVDWAMRSLVFAHYGPHDYMLHKPDAPRVGIPVPLFNLVYHDCVILPWEMHQNRPGGDYLLHALLNGGTAYLDCELEGEALNQQIARWRIVSRLHKQVAYSEMVRHELLDASGDRQKVVFSDGTSVSVDFIQGTYEIQMNGTDA